LFDNSKMMNEIYYKIGKNYLGAICMVSIFVKVIY